jgi:hypothetical protein
MLGKRGRCPRCGETFGLVRPKEGPQEDEREERVTERPPAARPNRRRPDDHEEKPDEPSGRKDSATRVSARRSTPAQESEPDELQDDADERPRKKKKKKGKKKARQSLRDDSEWPAWPWWVFGGGGVALTMIVLLGLTLFTDHDSPMKGRALYLLISVPISMVIFFVAVIITSLAIEALDIGEIHVAIFKAFLLVLVVNLVRLVPFGGYLTLLVWLVGLMALFRLDLWEARMVILINWLLNMAVSFFLLGVLLSGGNMRDGDRDIRGRQEIPAPNAQPAPEFDDP